MSTLNDLSSAGFIFKTIKSVNCFLRRWRGLKKKKKCPYNHPFPALASHKSPTGKKPLQWLTFQKVRTESSEGYTTNAAPLVPHPPPHWFSSQPHRAVSTDVEPLDRTLAHRLPELAESSPHKFFVSFSVPEVLCDLTVVLAKAFGISLDRSCLWPVPRRQSWRVGFRAWTPEHGYLWVKQWPWPFLQRPRAQCVWVWLLVFFHVA